MNYDYTPDDGGNILNQQTECGSYQFGCGELDRLEAADNSNLSDETYIYDEDKGKTYYFFCSRD